MIDHLAVFEAAMGLICGFCARGLVDKLLARRKRQRDRILDLMSVERWR